MCHIIPTKPIKEATIIQLLGTHLVNVGFRTFGRSQICCLLSYNNAHHFFWKFLIMLTFRYLSQECSSILKFDISSQSTLILLFTWGWYLVIRPRLYVCSSSTTYNSSFYGFVSFHKLDDQSIIILLHSVL